MELTHARRYVWAATMSTILTPPGSRGGGPGAARSAAQLAAQDDRTLVRFVVCGSVDDGKSTLMGRLLYDAEGLFSDEVERLRADSETAGTVPGELDFALLLDGLAAERAQGITIDIAYRHLSTERCDLLIADAPGHEQYTRNVVTGASTADCAVILVDATRGVLPQTRRHTRIVALLGIRDVALAINKIDLVDYSTRRLHEIEHEYRRFAAQVGLERVTCIPISALRGDNVVTRSSRTASYRGPTLIEFLETVEVDQVRMQDAPFRLPVQLVNRPDRRFRGYAGMIAAGTIRPGDPVVVAPSGTEAVIERIVTYDGDREFAVAGQSVTLTLSEDLDVTRGDVIGARDRPPGVAQQFQATIIWMGEEPMLPGRGYLMRIGGKTVTATLSPLKYKLSVETDEQLAATQLDLNEIGVCAIELGEPIAFDPYRANRDTGGFILVDRITSDTVGAGLIEFALRRSHNLSWQHLTIDKRARASTMQQRPLVLWLTGLSGAGKSTIGNLVECELHRRGHHTYMLDGDNVRHGLNSDLGFTEADRVENIRRVAEVARLMTDAGLIVLVSFISPFRAERRTARSLFEPDEFVEVFVDAPLKVAEQRDPKGLYKKARRGELRNLTGIDSPYEPPENPELRIDTTEVLPQHAAQAIIELLERTARL
jgi:bifunctional enzyme CysN/CysC